MVDDSNFIYNWLEKAKKETGLDISILELIEQNLGGINNLELDESDLLKQLLDIKNEEVENAGN